MPAEVLCRVPLPDGQPCGFKPEGHTRKEQLIALFKHERDVHLPKKDGP